MNDLALFALEVVVDVIASLAGVLLGRFLRRTLPAKRAKVVRLTLGGALIGVGVSFFFTNMTGAGPSPWIGALIGASSGFLLYMLT